ncbi:MAG: aldo/keto reductase family protein [Phycisphaerales bacterium]|nr:MAG: aldo/keto reductase family protein [Phycisphaerales bacterium]
MTTPDMRYRRLGRCGTQVSLLGLGGWTTFGGSVTDEKVVRATLTGAFEAGINFFDIADVYDNGKSEMAMGKVLGELPRHELVISSKVYFPMSDEVNDKGLSRKHITESIEKSLDRIGTDYLDIYFCHRYDQDTPLEETMRAMDDLVHQGKVLYWGTSEWTGAQLRGAHRLGDQRNLYHPQVEQPQYSLLARYKFESDVLPAVNELGMGLVVWSPLASGLLTGKYDDGIPADSRFGRIDWIRNWFYTNARVESVRQFKAVAQEVGCSRSQLALAWVASEAGVSSVILGCTSPQQLKENLGSLSVDVTEEIRVKLDGLFPCDESSKI